MLESIRQDLSHVRHSLRAAPGLALFAVLVLSVAIAAVTSIFTVLHARHVHANE